MKAPSYSATGTKQTEVTLSDKIFGLKVNPELLAQAYRRYLGNQRTNNAQTLTRGLVSGGGRKPYRQKGTGRARTGSIRNPIWRGGGITFGPTGIENYSRKMPRSMARIALLQALSSQAKSVSVIEKFDFKTPKTAEAVKLLAKLEAEGNVLIVAENPTPATIKSVANIPFVQVVRSYELNVFDILNADMIIVEQGALAGIENPTQVKAEAKS